MTLVSVLIPTIPSREHLFEECRASVVAQSYPEVEIVYLLDTLRDGCAKTMNRLAERAKGEWLFIFADDDVMLPGCIQAHVDASGDADIVYAPPLVWGEPSEWFTQAPPVIPSHALIRKSLWMELGGYDESKVREEDRDLWIKALAAGARFVRADSQPTWVYRLAHGGNKSFNQGVAA